MADFTDEFPRIRVREVVRGRKEVIIEKSAVAIESMEQPYGGVRRFFLCPWCSRRCLDLYLVGVQVACRICHGLRYRSQYVPRLRKALWGVLRFYEKLTMLRNPAYRGELTRRAGKNARKLKRYFDQLNNQ